MSHQQVNINDLSLERLKALAYDQIVTIERTQLILRQLNDEIARREQEPPKPTQEDVLQAGLDAIGGRHKAADLPAAKPKPE